MALPFITPPEIGARGAAGGEDGPSLRSVFVVGGVALGNGVAFSAFPISAGLGGALDWAVAEVDSSLLRAGLGEETDVTPGDTEFCSRPRTRIRYEERLNETDLSSD